MSGRGTARDGAGAGRRTDPDAPWYQRAAAQGMNGIQFADRLNSLALQWRVPTVLFLTAHPTLERAVVELITA